MPGFAAFAAEQRKELPVLANAENCGGKTFIVIGANGGLGFETTKHLVAAKAAKVIMACRNQQSGEEAKKQIATATGHGGEAMEIWPLDLAKFDSVKTFAHRAAQDLDRIDGLVASASVALDEWSTAEGHETSVTTNLISTYLLIVSLYPKLSQTAKTFNAVSHAVLVVSAAAFMMSPTVMENIKDDPFGKMDRKDGSEMAMRYPLTKLVQLYAGLDFSRHVPVESTGVVFDMVNPGLFKSQLSRSSRFATKARVAILNMILGRTAEQSSRTVLHALVVGRESHGHYLSGCEQKDHDVPTTITSVEGQELQKKIWNDLAKILVSIEPGCVTALQQI